MTITFEQIIDLFKQTTELRKVVTNLQTNPTGLDSIKPLLTPAVEALVKQFGKENSKEEFKKNILEAVNKNYSEQIDSFFADIEVLNNFIK